LVAHSTETPHTTGTRAHSQCIIETEPNHTGGGRHGTNALPATSILALAAAWATGKLNTVADATGEAITYALNHLGAATRLVVVVPSIAIIFLILAW